MVLSVIEAPATDTENVETAGMTLSPEEVDICRFSIQCWGADPPSSGSGVRRRCDRLYHAGPERTGRSTRDLFPEDSR